MRDWWSKRKEMNRKQGRVFEPSSKTSLWGDDICSEIWMIRESLLQRSNGKGLLGRRNCKCKDKRNVGEDSRSRRRLLHSEDSGMSPQTHERLPPPRWKAMIMAENVERMEPCKLLQPEWKMVWRLLEVKTKIAVWSSTLTLLCTHPTEMLRRHLHFHVHYSVIQNRQDGKQPVSLHGGMDKENVAHGHREILFSLKNNHKGKPVLCNDMDKSVGSC